MSISRAVCIPRAVCILGPTGSGKTEAALSLAAVMPVTVVNYDSRQVYADFPVVTAQPEPHEQAQHEPGPCADGMASDCSHRDSRICRPDHDGALQPAPP